MIIRCMRCGRKVRATLSEWPSGWIADLAGTLAERGTVRGYCPRHVPRSAKVQQS